MAPALPFGFGFVPGRSRQTALKLLEAADAIDFDRQASIRSTRDGYQVDEKVLEEYNSRLDDEDTAIDAPVSDDQSGPIEQGTDETAGTPASGEATLTPPADDTAGADGGNDGEPASDGKTEEGGEAPAKNASREEWATFAAAQPNWDEKTDSELSRNELVAKFASDSEAK